MWTYDIAQLNDQSLFQIRLLIGDTDQDSPMLQDEEINYFFASNNSAIKRAALASAKACLLKITSAPDYKLGPYEESTKSRVDALHTVIAELNTATVSMNAPISMAPTTEAIFGYDVLDMVCHRQREDDIIE